MSKNVKPTKCCISPYTEERIKKVLPDNVDENKKNYPVIFTQFCEITNVDELAVATMKKRKPRNHAIYLSNERCMLAQKYLIYENFYKSEKQRKIEPVYSIYLKDNCPEEIRNIFWLFSKPKVVATPRSDIGFNSEDEYSLNFLVTFTEFCKFTNCEKVTDDIVKKSTNKLGIDAKEIPRNSEKWMKIARTLYKNFYTSKEKREENGVQIKPCPKSIKLRLLKFVQNTNEDVGEVNNQKPMDIDRPQLENNNELEMVENLPQMENNMKVGEETSFEQIQHDWNNMMEIKIAKPQSESNLHVEIDENRLETENDSENESRNPSAASSQCTNSTLYEIVDMDVEQNFLVIKNHIVKNTSNLTIYEDFDIEIEENIETNKNLSRVECNSDSETKTAEHPSTANGNFFIVVGSTGTATDKIETTFPVTWDQFLILTNVLKLSEELLGNKCGIRKSDDWRKGLIILSRKLYRDFYTTSRYNPIFRKLFVRYDYIDVVTSEPSKISQLDTEDKDQNSSSHNLPVNDKPIIQSVEILPTLNIENVPQGMSSTWQFPVPFKTFCMHTHYDRVVKKVLNKHYEENSIEWQKIALEIYENFYKSDEKRKEYNIILKPGPKNFHNKLLKFAIKNEDNHQLESGEETTFNNEMNSTAIEKVSESPHATSSNKNIQNDPNTKNDCSENIKLVNKKRKLHNRNSTEESLTDPN